MIDGARVLQRLGPLPDALAADPRVWVVGGAVRDVLLGRPPREIDLAVEGDAASLGLGGLSHERFGTVVVDGMDLASTRLETYARPGALPDVRPGATMAEDLARRDFTVNTFAVRLVDGGAIAWPGAEQDLAAGMLRVLHPGSFVDDPTRLLRLVRYAARLGFTPEPETAALASAAVSSGALETVAGARLGDELRRIIDEDSVAALEMFGIGAALFGSFVSRGGAGLAALAASLLDAGPVRERLDWLAFPAAERDAVVAAAGRARAVASRLSSATSASDIVRVARNERPLTVEVAGLLGASEPARRWLDELRHVRLAITGDDLVAAGLNGPAVGAGLRAAMEAYVDGNAPDRESQLRVAKRL